MEKRFDMARQIEAAWSALHSNKEWYRLPGSGSGVITMIDILEIIVEIQTGTF
jgi:hypothetical protein